MKKLDQLGSQLQRLEESHVKEVENQNIKIEGLATEVT
jgi:hypothetical protein